MQSYAYPTAIPAAGAGHSSRPTSNGNGHYPVHGKGATSHGAPHSTLHEYLQYTSQTSGPRQSPFQRDSNMSAPLATSSAADTVSAGAAQTGSTSAIDDVKDESDQEEGSSSK